MTKDMTEQVVWNKKWFAFISAVRQWMLEQQYQEVITPTLVPAGAMEATLLAFDVEFRFGSARQRWQLPTSPEFHLKKLLALGWGSLFEIKTCFRNEEYSKIHRPEFTMLEFYRVGACLKDLRKEVEDLILHFALSPVAVHHWTMAECFARIGCHLSPQTSAEELRLYCSQNHIVWSDEDDFDDLFFRIWLEKIEPYLPSQALVFIYDFPPSQAALAEIRQDSGWADRFEVYWKGLELGNAFKELANSKLLNQRYEEENLKRQSRGLSPHPKDSDFLQCADRLPLCSGIAMGLERLFMAIHDLEKISDFKVLDPQIKIAQT